MQAQDTCGRGGVGRILATAFGAKPENADKLVELLNHPDVEVNVVFDPYEDSGRSFEGAEGIGTSGETLISVLMQAQDSAERSVPNSKQWEAVKRLVEVASRATCEPRRFHENDDGWQQEMGEAIVAVRLQMPRPASDFAHKFKESDQWPS